MTLQEQIQATLGSTYKFERELGGGGMSRVFLAEESRLGRKVVVKVLAPELAAGLNAERFEREIRLVASMQQANIVPLLTAGEVDGLPYFTMPFVEGQSLRSRLRSGPALTVAECVSIVRDVARALGYAHERGVVHRDIKPDNVLLSRGAAEVTDFGIAKAIAASRAPREAETLTQLGTSLGTPAYMSPEQAAGDSDVDGRADIYALGCMAYEMLEGRPPFSGTAAHVMAAHINTPPPTIPREDVPPNLQRLVMKCLAKEPTQRYQSADELVADLDAITTPSDGYPSVGRVTTRRMVTFAVAIVAIAAVGWFGSRGMRDRRWVRNEAIPRIRDLVERAQIESAFVLASRAATITPNDSVLTSLWPRFSTKVALHSVPEGAKVYRASFDDTSAWVYFGTTPTDSIRVPLRVGRLRVEKQGYRTISGLTGWWTYKLRPTDSPDSGMVLVPGGREIAAFLVGTEGNKPLPLGDFLMDKHEVTNREYKAFVDAGGYRNRDLWPPGTDVAKYIDKTGRPGPSTWEAGDYPVEQAELPVGGVSWYEAKAYSAFVHKSLPTIYHWARAANIAQARFVVPGSNFESTAPVRGGMLRGVSEYGLFDMAGNVREWCENAAGVDERYILGGGFSDPPYQFTDAYAQPASNRAPINGIRLVKYLNDTEPSLALAKAPQPRAFRDYTREKPASNAEYEAFRHTFDYDRTALNPRVDRRDTTEDWIIERVSYDAAYGGERMFANLYLPKHGKPPYQTVVVFPGSGVISNPASVARRDGFGFVATAGRMLVLPILKSTFERRDSLHSDVSDNSIFWRDHVVMWVKDMRRTLDYLSTRPDVDTTKFAYFGYSWGSNMAPINLALEPRFQVVVLYVAGLTMEASRPEVDPFNYLPHVKQPALMLNGRYDFFFPVEIAQRPFFQNLGTPASQRLWKVYEGGHDVPRADLIGETLKWLDKYLGPVP